MASSLLNLPIDSPFILKQGNSTISNSNYNFLVRMSKDSLEVSVTESSGALLQFEEDFNFVRSKQWMDDNWTNTYYVVLLYLLVIFGGKHLMKNRPRFELRGVLALWSFTLAAFSIMGTYRVVPELLSVLRREHGFHHSVCFGGFETNKKMSFWAWIFAISKIVELGDTVFIVLRKQPLIFLHWYHHVTVLLYTWDSCVECISPSRWYIAVNFFVHSFMYTYYGLRALRFTIPKPIAVAITSSQLLQMVVGVTVNIHAFNAKQNGIPCGVSYKNINTSFAMYFSYLILFAHFFYKAYVAKPKSKLNNSDPKSQKGLTPNSNANAKSNQAQDTHQRTPESGKLQLDLKKIE